MDRARRKALLDRFRVSDGKAFSLSDHAPDADPGGALDKAQGEALLAAGVARLAHLQQLLYADGRWALLAVFQAMDAGGKDGTIRHVLSGVNPQGVKVTSFKQPGPVELSHDFLWRVHLAVPSRGQIGVFNRSHYEELLIARIHPEVLEGQSLPERRRGDRFWQDRMKDIRHFERYLDRQGIVVVKFFLNISREEQRQRFLARLEEPEKNWKFSQADLEERAVWSQYRTAYEEMVAGTARKHAPWYVVPGDRKWFARLVVVEAMIQALEALDLSAPEPALQDATLRAAKAKLQAEAG